MNGREGQPWKMKGETQQRPSTTCVPGNLFISYCQFIFDYIHLVSFTKYNTIFRTVISYFMIIF